MVSRCMRLLCAFGSVAAQDLFEKQGKFLAQHGLATPAASPNATHQYSVWLMPEPGELQQELDEMVKQTSAKFAGPSFDFHVTLVGGIPRSSLSSFKLEIEALANTIQPFQVVFPANSSLAVFGTWSQNVVLLVEATEAFKTANLAAIRALNDPMAIVPAFPGPTNQPHGSLLYGVQEQQTRQDAKQWVRHQAPWLNDGWAFEAKRLVIYETDGPTERYWEGVPGWKRVAEFPLKHA